MRELAKATPVVVVQQGKQIDPLFLKVFKPELLILEIPITSIKVPNTIAK